MAGSATTGTTTSAGAGNALSAAERQALAAGQHPNPFARLGPHRLGDGGWVVRAIVPGAEAVTLHGAAGPHPMTSPGDGFWEATLVADPGPYRLEGARGTDRWQIEDAYRFGPVLGEADEYYVSEGTHRTLWRRLGAQMMTHEGTAGVAFAVWAPSARRVSVVGDFNAWDGRRHVMRWRGASGIAEIFIPGLEEGARYKFEILGADGGLHHKADPVGFGAEHPPANASVVRALPAPPEDDSTWMRDRGARQRRDAPISIYEVHLPSWLRDDQGRPLDWDALAARLVPYAADLGFTHLELMPVSEYPFDGSWGYQPVGLYAPTARHGDPAGLRRFVRAAHDAGMGVLLDWVVGHFPTDAHGLGRFDGTPLYEHADPREGFHRDWNTLIYNFGRREVANYLAANGVYWLQEYGIDGIRVDAVASMLYRDYSREEGDWIPNRHGGRENLEAIDFLKRMNTEVYGAVPGVMTVAEESTAWPGVSRPVEHGGLGFGYKWNMGWMNDTLRYMQTPFEHRPQHHDLMTFGLHYAFSENFILPLSHDEVVHGKGSLLGRMPGDAWQRLAGLRAYYAFMWGHPGKKLLFMGGEFAQPGEWNHDYTIDWHAAGFDHHDGVRRLVRDLNRIYRENPALHALDAEAAGFEWVDGAASQGSVFAWLRHGPAHDPGDAPPVLCLYNFSPVERGGWRFGVPRPGAWAEILNSDADLYGGGGRGNLGGVTAEPVESHGRPYSVTVTLPPLSGVMLRHDG
ncbi:MAG: 1,4-alpha-glucan branching protein GlgB [Pseudomonadota bacterium]